MANNIKLTIHRFEFTTSPTIGKLVGFLVTDINSSNVKYVETFLRNEDIQELDDAAICSLAYKNLEPKINQISENYLKASSLLGSEFVP